jgi:PAS domain S-box-containing protein
MKTIITRTIKIVLGAAYIIGIIVYIAFHSYNPQTASLITIFLLTNLPLILIIVFRKTNEDLRWEIKNKEIELSLNKKRWESLVELLPQMVYEYKSDLEGHLTFVNTYGLRLLGYKPRLIKKMNFLDFFDPADHKKLITDRAEIVKDQKIIICEHVAIKSDGTRFPVALYSAPILDERRKTAGIRSILIDLSEIKRFRQTIEDLKNLDKTKDDFLNIAAHELKTPLTSILILSEILKGKSSEIKNDEISQQIGVIFGEAKRLKRIIDQILTITRFENKRNLYKSERFDLTQKVKDFIPTIQTLIDTHGAKMEISISKSPALVYANPDKILEVVYNFVDNAIKYGSRDQTIGLQLLVRGNNVKVEVNDTGRGIDKNKLQSIFTKFGQLDNSYSRSQEGIGLGLYICKLIIESYHGQIGVNSVINRGSTFYFTLPLAKSVTLEKHDI